MIKQSDLALKLGVSRVTVTKALQNSHDISQEMKAKVKKLAAELDYIPNLAARNFSAKKTNTIGIVIPDITNLYFSTIISGMMDVAEKECFNIILTASREKSKDERKNILNLLSLNVDGLLVCQSLDSVKPEIFERVKKRNKPIVFFGRPVGFSGFDSVGFDDYKAAVDLTEYLIEKGKTNIAHISGNLKSDGKFRLQGFLDTMKKHLLKVKKKWIIEGDYFPEFGFKGFNKIYNGILPEPFCGNLIVEGVRKRQDQRNIIPNDISVAAIGHKKFADLLYPKLTIIDYPTKKLGEEAMKLIISKINLKTEKNNNIILQTKLIENDSVI
jgi:DNA-binding LacI/PurR family transcriptional regulator